MSKFWKNWNKFWYTGTPCVSELGREILSDPVKSRKLAEAIRKSRRTPEEQKHYERVQKLKRINEEI